MAANVPVHSGSSQKQIFISYSHEPVENADFVRWLAGNLRIAGFKTWIDEEDLPGGASILDAIAQAIKESDAGLFVVNKRWEERWYTRHEVTLFGERPSARRVVLQRDPVDLGKLGPFLSDLKSVSWLPDDADREARFWEIYCGLHGRVLGPRASWHDEGAKVLRSPATALARQAVSSVVVAKEHTRPEATMVSLTCAGKPISCLVGGDWNFLVTDRQEWVGIRRDGERHQAVAGLAEHTAAFVNASGQLLVGLYSSQIARLAGQEWEYVAQEAPVMSLCSCPEGDVFGTASGAIQLVDASGKSSTICRMRDPVMGLAPYEGGVVALGSRGAFGRLSWPAADGAGSLKWIETGALGRPAGFFTCVEHDHVGVYSEVRLGIIHPGTGRRILCSTVFEEGIREVVFFGAQRWPYGVLTDAGTLILVDTALHQTLPVRLGTSAPVRGCSPGGWAGIATAWTADGALFRLAFDRPSTLIAEHDVVLGYAPPGDERVVHVVRWTAADGARVEMRRF